MTQASPVTVTFLGDVFPANTPYRVGRGVASCFHDHRGEPWKEFFFRLFSGSDEVIGNLEAPLSENEEEADQGAFTGHAGLVRFLRECGLTGVGIANNHMLENGSAGFHDTLSILRGLPLRVTGYCADGIPHVEVIERNGLRIGLVAFNEVQDLPNPGLICNYSPEMIRETLESMHDLDFRVVMPHWGSEYVPFPSPAQIEAAHRMVDWGADVIVGHHPHVLQPFERYRNGLILYSLGNFIFDMEFTKRVMIGAAFRVTFSPDHRLDLEIRGFRRDGSYRFSPVDEREIAATLEAQWKIGLAEAPTEERYRAIHRDIHSRSRLEMLSTNLRYLPRMSGVSRRLFLARLLRLTHRRRP